MQVQPRVLGYLTSKELTNHDLAQVSGGEAKLSVQTSQRATGQPPGPVDVEFDQIWD